MCGIFFAISQDHLLIDNISSKRKNISKTIVRRGPDKLSTLKDKNFFAIHTLLSMTGLREQPLITKNSMILFNGEVYNHYLKYNFKYSDTDFVAEKIESLNETAFKKFDGEFAICAYLFNQNKLLLATDPFATKPLYFQLGKNYCIAGSYDTTVSAANRKEPVEQVPANTLIEIDLNKFKIRSKTIIRPFDFTYSEVKSFDKWNKAFQKALVKRTFSTRHRVFLGLSSGHDSGLMAAEMIKRKIPFHAYIMTYLEDKDVINERIKILKKNKVSYEIVDPNLKSWKRMTKFIEKNAEPYQLINSEDSFRNYKNPDYKKAPGYIASALIFEKARKEGKIISLSGQGGDEIYADYYNPSSNSRMSQLKGKWDNISSPWKNFYGGWNRVFLGGTERIAGLFGIEARYPFLDFDLVQEFINLHPSLKSLYYKSPLTNRLTELGFPYHLRKFGFAGFKDPEITFTKKRIRI